MLDEEHRKFRRKITIATEFSTRDIKFGEKIVSKSTSDIEQSVPLEQSIKT